MARQPKWRSVDDKPRMEQFITPWEMQQASVDEAIVNLFGADALEKIHAESQKVQRKWKRELAADKRKNPEYYPDDDDQDGNYYGGTT